jgi:TolA-binding protein
MGVCPCTSGVLMQLAAELVTYQRNHYVLAAEVFRQWQAAEGRVRELEDCWPALQQLLVDILATQQQLQAASTDIRASGVSAAVQAATPVFGGAADGGAAAATGSVRESVAAET